MRVESMVMVLVSFLMFRPGHALSNRFVESSASFLLQYECPNLPNFLQDPSFERFRLGLTPLICIPNAIDSSKIQEWKADAVALRSLAFGASAGVASGQGGIRSGVHQVWLKSPGCPDQRHLVGNIDARRDLEKIIDGLRASLDHEEIRSLPPELIELSYLLYDANGASYAKHVDSFADSTVSNRKRCVSFLLYLGAGDDSHLAWDGARDGGVLRIHGAEYAQETGESIETSPAGAWSDVTPHPGTIVLFDSALVPHEVVATKRSRICVVGWLGTYKK